MDTMGKDDIVPSGSFIPGEGDDSATTTVTPPAPAAPEIPDKFKGKETPDIIKSYQELESKHGQSAQELGALRQTVQILTDQLTKVNQAQGTTPTKTEARDYNKEIADLAAKVTSGDIDIAQALLQTAALTEEKTLTSAQKMMKEQEYRGKAEGLQKDFLSKNPDFVELDRTGAFQKVWEAEPLLYGDKVGAYHALKASQAKDELAATKAALAEKDRIVQEQIRQGVKVADQGLQKPGQGARTPAGPGEPKNDRERADGMMAALVKARGGA
jgi:hypothetical protein